MDTVQATLQLKLGIRQAVATALDELSVAMVPLEDMTAEDATCADDPCYMAIAKRVEATHVLVLQGVANPAGYRLSLEVRAGETGLLLGSDAKDCELCAEDQFVPTVQDKVSKLWKRVIREQESKPQTPTMGPVSDTETRPGVDVSWWKQRKPLMGIGFGAVGLVAVGFGVYYILEDGKSVEKTPNGNPVILRDTGKWGWSLLGVGVVALAAGATMVIWGRDDGTSVSVAVGPASLGLQGKF